MPVQNVDVSEIFRRIANLLEIEGANPFRVRAYRNAARSVDSLPRNISEMVEAGEDLTELPGVGKDIAGKISEIVNTGALKQLKDLEGRTPAELDKLMNISGLGPRRVKALYMNLGIKSLEDLKTAAEEQKIRELNGFGEKTEQSILESLAGAEQEEQRIQLHEAEQRAAPLVEYLKDHEGVERITVAGSYRRRKETVGDLDILAVCKKNQSVMEYFTVYEDVQKVVSKGDTRSTVVLKSGLQVDLRVLPEAGYGAGLHYFTGSKAHNIAVRKKAVKRNLKINEYGVYRGDERIAGKTEQEVYDQVGLAYIEPELREDDGEIEAAETDNLPALAALEDIRGDLHSHTKASDGHDTLEDMVQAAQNLGYEYLAVTDHSKRVAMANGLDAGRLERQIERINKLNEKLDGFRILKGVEVDILEDGSLDLDDDILEKLDIRVCSIHYNLSLSREKQTSRILKAMENPYFNILGHPTGRIIGQRKGYEIDLEKIMKTAAESGCFMELNADPQRLDLTDTHCRMAGESGVKIAIATDAHSRGSLEFMRFGVNQARRGWMGPENVINTRNCEDLLKLIKRR